jgi:protein TonB
MFNTLLESKSKPQRSPGGAAGSVVAHVIIISLVAYATAHAAIHAEKEKVEKIEFTEMKKTEAPPPPKPQPPPPQAVVAPPPPKGFQVLTAPVNIPDVIPDVDLTKKVTDEADFTGKGAVGGNSHGAVGGTGPVNTDQPYFDFQVEKQAGPVPGNVPPRYPEMLHSAGIEGEVLAQFVIDTTGRADMSTFKIIKASHDLFGSSVKEALPRMRFYPAEVGGHKVKELVQQPFSFAITK